jgi:hypothetical protein
MARRNRDLAGLAALGALGYAMFGGDKNKVRADGGAPVEDRSTAVRQQAAQAAAAQAAGFEDTRGLEGGIEPLGLRRNELGELSDPIGGYFDRPTARPTARPRVRPYSKAEAMTDLARETARGRRGPIATPFEREPDYVSKRKPNVIYDAQGREVRPLKKGGAVKKMASGGMTSASKRADGIATKGKTKCKMY